MKQTHHLDMEPLEVENIVIGAGPSGLHATRSLIRLGKRVTVIDIKNQSSITSESGISSPVKRHPDIQKVLDFGRFYKLKWEDGYSGNLQPSIATGGLSNIWGASITSIQLSDAKLHEIFGEYVYQTSKIENDLLSNEVSEIINFLAVSPERCKRTGACNTICPNNAIWNAAHEFKLLEKEIDLIEGNVVRINLKSDKWEVYFRGESSPRYLSKRIFLCAGALASSIIAMNSDLLPKSGVFSDTQAIFIPVLHAKNRIQSEHGVALSQRSFNLRDKGIISGYFQYYPNVASVMNEAISLGPRGTRFLIKIFWGVINPFLGFGILFLTPELSNEIRITQIQDKFVLGVKLNTELANNITNNLQKLNSLRKYGLFTLTKFAKIRNTGDSFHYGSFRASGSASFEVTDLKELSGFPSLHFMDGFSLKKVPTGPVTPSILAEGELVIRKIFDHK